MNDLKKDSLKKSFFSIKFFLLLFGLIITANIQAQNVSGTVVDEKNEPMMGVSVGVKGTNVGMSTNLDGKFSLNVTQPDAVLVFSYLGYITKEEKVAGRTNITVVMAENLQLLDEVVVVGFQTQKKVNLTGAVTAVGAETFENRPVSNIGQALQGLIPNLNVGISNGAPNTVPSFNLRGGTSIEKNSDGDWVVTNDAPLILVDGVDISATMLNQMNPNDIESMSVIKDASAAAIYGTKATYGVILITTKGGKFNQKGKISYSYDMTWSTPSALPDIMNSVQLQEAAMSVTRITLGTVSQLDLNKLEASKKYLANPTMENRYFMNGSSIVWVGNMNPYEEVVRDWSPMQNHNLNLSGGTDKVSYYLSLGYQTEEGEYKINTDQYDRFNGMLRINAKVNSWFNVDGKINYNRTNYDSPYVAGYKGNIWSILKNDADKNIMMPIMTGPDDPIPNTYTDNFLGWLSYGAKQSTSSYTTMFYVSPEFILIPKTLKIKADLSYSPQASNYTRNSPQHNYITYSWNNTVCEVEEVSDNRGVLRKTVTDTYLINVYADFNKTFAKKHHVSAILGFNQDFVDYTSLETNLRGLFSPYILKPSAAEDITLHTIATSAQRRTGRAAFGRFNYNFSDRYLFEVNWRYDGSSRFTPDERFLSFPSISAGWRISEEKFMSSTKEWLSNLKIRGSWGKLGSQPSSYYPYQPTMSSGNANFILDGKYVSTVNAPGLVSPLLTWQKATTTNFGLDLGVLNNKLNASFDIYERKTTDILTDGTEAYPNILGANPPLVNSGSMKANGWEFELSWKDRLPNGLSYNAGLTVGDSRTKVLVFPSNTNKIIGQLYDGHYVGEIWGYETGGILQPSDLVLEGNKYIFYGPYHTGNLYPGNIWYRDLNGDGIINTGANTVADPGDRRIIGNSTPRYRFGLTLGASWKGFDFNALFQGVGKRDLWISSSTYWGSTTNGAGSKWMYEQSWTPENPDAKFPRYLSSPSTQTGYLVNGAYLRMKQVILGYTLPSTLTKKLGVEKLRFNLSGYNLFDITDIPSMFDPDQISDAYPQKRRFAVGAQITF